MRSFCLFILLLLGTHPGHACVNEESIRLSGQNLLLDGRELVPYGHGLHKRKGEFQAELQEKDSLWRRYKNVSDYNDYGVMLIYLGRYEEAKEVFIEIEGLQPGRYSTAANLGTTYELLGKNDSALYWIKKAVSIDPASHFGSEWLHVKILEAKMGGEAFINSSFLLGAHFGNDVVPKTNMDSAALVKLSNSLYYQLNERVSFVKPPDKIVGLLLFELGNMNAITKDLVTAMKIYDRAKEYGFADSVLVKRYEEFKRRLIYSNVDNEYVRKLKGEPVIPGTETGATKQSNVRTLLIVGGIIVVLFVWGIWIWRRS